MTIFAPLAILCILCINVKSLPMRFDQTIAALSTAATPAARIILRLAGPRSHPIAAALTGTELSAGSASRVFLSFSDLRLPAWIYCFRAPRSYTGDDLIEFHIPGSPVLAKLLLDELFKCGAVPAEPGEFTARAYFNGRLGLTEAEGVAATIAAGNESELRAARQLFAGELARRLNPIMEGLAQTLALIEVGIDFSEEEVKFLAADEVRRQIGLAEQSLADLVDQSGRFEALTPEPRIVFAGRPNAGKSSLINALTGCERAIVSEIAGTTRDILTSPLDLPRGRVLLADVAGIETQEPVSEALRRPGSTGEDSGSSEYLSAGLAEQNRIDEQMQLRARTAIESADLLVLVRDSTDAREPVALRRSADMVVFTKADLLGAAPSLLQGILVSSKTGDGLNDLREALDRLAFGVETGSALALNRRHLSSISEARAALKRAAEKVREDAAELVAAELREALDHLGSILGSITPDDVLGRVFSAFCIGK